MCRLTVSSSASHSRLESDRTKACRGIRHRSHRPPSTQPVIMASCACDVSSCDPTALEKGRAMGLSPPRCSRFSSLGRCSIGIQSCVHECRYSSTPRWPRVFFFNTYRRGVVGSSGKSCIHEYRYHGGFDQLSRGIPTNNGRARDDRYILIQVR